MQKGTLSPRLAMWTPPNYIDVIIGSQSSDLIGRPIYTAFFDEISFIRRQDIEK